MFLGKPISFWLEIKHHLDIDPEVGRLTESLAKENSQLRSRAYEAEGKLKDVSRIATSV